MKSAHPHRTEKNERGKVPVLSLARAIRLAQKARKHGECVITTNGCFDILHVGHVRYLAWAKRRGDILIVGVNSDASVRKLKGMGRPISGEKERAEIVASLKSVDAVCIFRESTPERWLAKMRPHFHVKGGDRSMHEIVEKDVVEKNGGRVLLAPHVKGKSTSKVLRRARL